MKKTREFLSICAWVFKFYWRMAPVLLIIYLTSQLFLSLQSIIYAFVFGIALDEILLLVQSQDKSLEELIYPITLLLIIFFIFNLVSLISARTMTIITQRDSWHLRKYLYEHLRNIGLTNLENPELTNKTTRFNEVYGSISNFLSLIVSLFGVILSLTTGIVVLATFAPILVPLLVLIFVTKFVVNKKYVGLSWKLVRETTEERRRASTTGGGLSDPVSLKEVTITNSYDFFAKKYMEFVTSITKAHDKIQLKWLRFELAQSFIDTLIYGLALFLIITKSILESISIGRITFLIRTTTTVYEHIDTLSYRIARAVDSSVRIKDIKDIFELYKPEADGEKELAADGNSVTVEFKNVSFKYPNSEKFVLKDLNLNIRSGEKIALVGENGAGKTTLVKLLTRLYPVTGGEILIDEINLNDIKISSWYQKLGVLFQDFNTYSHLSVADNIIAGKADTNIVSNEKIISVLKAAGALEFVDKYPQKLDQILSERFKKGIRPSTGQWQKIAIARFFYRDAPVLILDEPTASIDAVSEAEIFDNIYGFMKDKTVIVISHRFSTVRNADRILVLDKGNIVEQGSHKELLAKKGKYAKAFKLQAQGYK